MGHEKLKALIEQARKERKVLYCSGNGQYYTPADLENYNTQGKCLWAIEHFELVEVDKMFSSKLEEKKPLKAEPKNVLYFPEVDCGNVRVFTEDISFWYYVNESSQTMIHLKSGECLRVEQDIETVDQKILESKEPAIGKELADFWYDIIVNGIHHNRNTKK